MPHFSFADIDVDKTFIQVHSSKNLENYGDFKNMCRDIYEEGKSKGNVFAPLVP